MLPRGSVHAVLLVLAPVMTQSAMSWRSDAPRFRDDGTFTIVQFTDIHMTTDTMNLTGEILDAVLDAEKPDFVAYTGDICSLDCWTMQTHSNSFLAAFGPSERRGIPWAVTFGNWDRHPEALMTGPQIVDWLPKTFKHSFNRPPLAGVRGDSVFDVPILPPGAEHSSETKPASVLYFLDTHANEGCEDIPGTGCLYPSEVAWYNDTSASYRAQNDGKPVQGMAFFHIPLPEHINAWNEGGSTYGKLDEPLGKYGNGICCVIRSSGFFDAAVANGDIKAMTCGHDHDNDFHGTYRGIELMYGRKSGMGSYGPPSSWGKFPAKDGARVIQLHRDPSTGSISVKTWIRLRDGSKLSQVQEGRHEPGVLRQARCHSVALADADRHQCKDDRYECRNPETSTYRYGDRLTGLWDMQYILLVMGISGLAALVGSLLAWSIRCLSFRIFNLKLGLWIKWMQLSDKDNAQGWSLVAAKSTEQQ